jgi:hypothetical protein
VDLPDSTTVKWYDISNAAWDSKADSDGGPERLSTPDAGYWVAVVRT